jgi:hypothetical protein
MLASTAQIAQVVGTKGHGYQCSSVFCSTVKSKSSYDICIPNSPLKSNMLNMSCLKSHLNFTRFFLISYNSCKGQQIFQLVR